MSASSLDSRDSLRVLVVEDQHMIAAEIQHCLRELGHEVMGPANSVAAAARQLDRGPRPDVGLVDINLGEGGSGYDVARLLERRAIPFIFCSVDAEVRDPRFADRPLLTKPVDRHVLCRTIERAVTAADHRTPARPPLHHRRAPNTGPSSDE